MDFSHSLVSAALQTTSLPPAARDTATKTESLRKLRRFNLPKDRPRTPPHKPRRASPVTVSARRFQTCFEFGCSTASTPRRGGLAASCCGERGEEIKREVDSTIIGNPIQDQLIQVGKCEMRRYELGFVAQARQVFGEFLVSRPKMRSTRHLPLACCTAKPVPHGANYHFRAVAMRLDVLAGDVGNEFLKPVTVPIQNQAPL